MKKIVLGLLASLSLSFADNYGIIESVNDADKTIVVNQTKIKILPYTKIEEEAYGSGWDTPKKFSDLKAGQVVEVEFMGVENNILIAKEIEIQCANRAY
ncbi:hypothetical protein CQA62_02235 [Helicobacter cholecystus]|uniref:DUF5666 domain-containing protein n=1 Tax=Helicobacter cholecystus TaxID=45498 RepID=A0A3D8IW23_9HELI|nr:DUF5666 domain-containing protein [Helicobacter cholecystus]RDU69489.1 hypothetical protein CQA62_02235 [Helicobacter cholecystus]VEJ24040.1 Uncharacterised protein [Helicobacter cholecystus]